MSAGFRDSVTQVELGWLREAMNWVIPPDSSPGAGSDVGIARLLDLIESQPGAVAATYRRNMGVFSESDLADPSNEFAAMFTEHVRDIYYAHPETGSWADIGFEVVDP